MGEFPGTLALRGYRQVNYPKLPESANENLQTAQISVRYHFLCGLALISPLLGYYVGV